MLLENLRERGEASGGRKRKKDLCLRQGLAEEGLRDLQIQQQKK